MVNKSLINKKKIKRENKRNGYGLVDYIVNKLPEIHIPGYQYCGPGTKLEKRLARGDPGINKLDQACKDHDIAYSTLSNSKERRQADRALVSRALPRVYSRDAKLGERAAALLVTGLMGAKIGLSKIGLGLAVKKKKKNKHKKMKNVNKGRRVKKQKTNRSKMKRKSIAFGKLVRTAKASIKKSKKKSLSLNDTVKAAVRKIKEIRRGKTVKMTRILKVPKFHGSALPLIPILAALSAVGSISASAAAVVKAIKEIQSIKRQETNGEIKKQIGRGLYLMSNESGSGFYLKPFQPVKT